MPETLLGFDYGTHKIGVAVGQELTGTANPLTVLNLVKGKPDWEGIRCLIDEWRPQGLVVGLPIGPREEETPMTTAARKFARQLEGRFGLPVHLADERLTSREAWSRIGGIATRDVTRIDSMAAKLILETWFSSL
ncbi:Holliday junction resolvase RuvX [Thiolapillus brandeum]|uniref:Putative pre-16S rRNA nuclease n=1 Tax=Thiolapillus brandeum TaxID=1076588 RepID=A0A7U6JJF7_9GAMM|nr:Holliday junction resolvase RuvX [Thiolapillus brandeum]BAO45503.1 Holliday junction resolvase [Thiolapillus brandeum]